MPDEVPQTQSADLTNCDREPIHIPNSVQPHGFLLAFRVGANGKATIEVASENAAEYLGARGKTLVGEEAKVALPRELAEMVHANIAAGGKADNSRFLGMVELAGERGRLNFQAVAFRTDDLFVVELEHTPEATNLGELNGAIARFVSSIEETTDVKTLCRVAAAQVRALTGFDRVMLYEFDEEGHGLVLAEDGNGRLPSYLGLSFPGSDIPRQARALYLLNRMRIIPAVDYTPSPLMATENAAGKPLDLSLSILRSVSPVHRDYMRNMGTIASMSVSIVVEGKLWGLISGHHSEPLAVPYLVRSACDVLSRIVSAQLLSHAKSEQMAQAIKLKSVQSQLLTYMAGGGNYVETLRSHPQELLGVTGAKSAAIVFGDQCALLGDTPSEGEVIRLVNRILSRGRGDVFVSSNLDSEYTASDEVRKRASGVIAVSLSQVHRLHLLWFRPEVVETLHWAGEPDKNVGRVDGVLQIHPRNSFASWRQMVYGRSEPWTAMEIDSARDFRSAMLEIVLKRAEEMADLVTELEAANKELEAFSYSVSHDLRAPFRHISGFAELMQVNEAERLSDVGKRHLATIAKSAQFAGLLVDSLLNFSRISRTKLERTQVRMNELVADVWRDVKAQELAGREAEFTSGDLPTMAVDLNLFRQVWRNLLSNAVKYTRNQPKTKIHVSCEWTGGELVFCVADNGVGFDQQFSHKLFGAFQRLHRMEDFEGTGIGLANVRRIVARHGGHTWAEGKEGEGAKIFFSLPESCLQLSQQEKIPEAKTGPVAQTPSA